MESKRGQSSKVLWWIVSIVFLVVAGYLYFTFKGEGVGLLDKFFNLF